MLTRSTVARFSLWLLLVCLAQSTVAAEPLDADKIKVGLKTNRPSEAAFIDRVVNMVNKGNLPRSLVESTFHWARRKPRNQFQYFQQALIIRAARIGIRL